MGRQRFQRRRRVRVLAMLLSPKIADCYALSFGIRLTGTSSPAVSADRDRGELVAQVHSERIVNSSDKQTVGLVVSTLVEQ